MATRDKHEMQQIAMQIAKQAETLAELQFVPKLDHDGKDKIEQGSSVEAGAMTVSVVWASHEKISSASLVVPAGTLVGRALELSGLLLEYQPAGLAIFGQRCDLTRPLKDGDRIELCRPLIVEPKAARRRRALHREKVRNIKKKMPIDDLTV